MTDIDYAAYLIEAQREIREKQAAVSRDYGLDAISGVSVDYGAGTLTFLVDGQPRVEATIQPIVMRVRASGLLLWAWASPELPAAVREAAARMQSFEAVSGLRIFSQRDARHDEATAWEIIALACKLFDAPSANRLPHGEVDSYVLLTSLRRLPSACQTSSAA